MMAHAMTLAAAVFGVPNPGMQRMELLEVTGMESGFILDSRLNYSFERRRKDNFDLIDLQFRQKDDGIWQV
jgi:hypothetical protein